MLTPYNLPFCLQDIHCQPTSTASFSWTLAYVTPRHSSTSLADGRAPWAPGPPSFLPATHDAKRNRNMVRLHNASSLVSSLALLLLLLLSRSKDMQWSKGKFCATRLMMYPAMKASPAPVVSTTVASQRVEMAQRNPQHHLNHVAHEKPALQNRRCPLSRRMSCSAISRPKWKIARWGGERFQSKDLAVSPLLQSEFPMYLR